MYLLFSVIGLPLPKLEHSFFIVLAVLIASFAPISLHRFTNVFPPLAQFGSSVPSISNTHTFGSDPHDFN